MQINENGSGAGVAELVQVVVVDVDEVTGLDRAFVPGLIDGDPGPRLDSDQMRPIVRVVRT